jgi:DNA polymerase-4
VFDTAVDLYRALHLDQPRVRLVGVKCENLEDAARAARQLSFDDLAQSGEPRRTDSVLDAARARFGATAVGYATLLRAPEPAPDAERRSSDA